MGTEQRIAKIIKATENGTFQAKAEGMTWDLYPKAFRSGKDLTVGDYVWSYVLHDEDNDEFYLEENPEKELSTETDWNEQEEIYA